MDKPNNTMLIAIVALLVKEFGAEAVRDEAVLQDQLRTIDYLARCMSGTSPTDTTRKINRIKTVRALEIVKGLREAKYWVEAHYEDEGKAPFVT